MEHAVTPSSRLSLNARVSAAILCLAVPSLLASEYADLKRTDPVPATEKIPVFDFVRPAVFSGVQLNHTGTQVGAIVPGDNDHTSLITYDLVGQKLDGVSAPTGDRDIASFEWLDGDRLVYVISEKKIAGRGLFLSTAGKLSVAEQVGAQGADGTIQILDNPPEDRTNLLVNLKGFNWRYDHPEMINAVNHGSLVTRYPELKTDHGFNNAFFSDKMGQLAFGITQEDGILSLSKLSGDDWTKCPEDVDQIDIVGSGDNPGEILVLGPRDGTAPRPLEFMDAATGTAKDVLLQDKGYDFDFQRIYRDPASHNIVGAYYNRAAPRVVWFTEAYRNLQGLVDKLFPNQVVRIEGMDDAGKVLLISNTSDHQPVVYSWVNLEKHTSGLIKNSQPWIDPKRMQPMGIIKYTTQEGRQLDAYITLPAGASKKNPPPMVVMPPQIRGERWTWGYDADVQFLASRGYAVLQPNIRSSVGYGWMFPESDLWDFRKQSDDVTRATKKAIEMGLVDKNRVAIMGTSFGGYLAVAGTTFEPGLYKCAVSVSGLYDWGKYISEDKYLQYTDTTYSRYLYKLGNPATNSAKYDGISPLPHASQCKSALLLTWGEFDNPELISQSKDMASAVEHAGVHVETLSYLDEADGVRHLAHKVDLYQHIEDFLAKNL